MALALALSILLLCSTPIGSFRPPPPPRRTAFARGFVVSFAVRDEDDILGLLGDGRLSLSVRGWPVLPQDCSRIGAITCCLRACSLVARADVSAFLPARRDERRRRVCEGGDVSGRCLYHHCVAVSIVEAWRRGRHGGRAAPPSSATLPLLRAPVRRCRGRAVDHPTTSLVRNGHGLQGPRPRHEDGRLGGPDHPRHRRLDSAVDDRRDERIEGRPRTRTTSWGSAAGTAVDSGARTLCHWRDRISRYWPSRVDVMAVWTPVAASS